LLLVIVPWTASWQHNYFGVMFPTVGDWMTNQYVRGAITGIGVITGVAGLRDLSSFMWARRPAPGSQERS
jgi:hypothetical protein